MANLLCYMTTSGINVFAACRSRVPEPHRRRNFARRNSFWHDCYYRSINRQSASTRSRPLLSRGKWDVKLYPICMPRSYPSILLPPIIFAITFPRQAHLTEAISSNHDWPVNTICEQHLMKLLPARQNASLFREMFYLLRLTWFMTACVRYKGTFSTSVEKTLRK